MGRSKRCRISVRFIRVLNTDGSTKKRYKLEEKGKHLTLISNPTQNDKSDSSCISTELLLAATTLSKASEEYQNSDEPIACLTDTQNTDISKENSLTTISEPESPPHSLDAFSPHVTKSIDSEKQNLDINLKKTSFADEFLKIETFAPIDSLWPSSSLSSPFSSPSSPEINLGSDFTVDEVPLNLNLGNTDNLLDNPRWNFSNDKVDSNDFGLNFPNFCSASSEGFPNLFSTW